MESRGPGTGRRAPELRRAAVGAAERWDAR